METRPGQVGTSIVVASLGLVGGLWCLSRTDLFGTFITSTLGALRRGGRRGTIEEEEEEGEERKRYVVRKEFYSSEKEDWKAVEERDDEDEDGKDPNQLFVVRKRSWPKSASYADYEDYTNLEIRSIHLIDFLRSVKALQEVEGVHEDKPSVDEQDLYLIRDQLEEALGKRKEKLEEIVKAASASNEEEEGDASIAQRHTEGVIESAKEEEKDEEELEEEIEHVQVLLDYIDHAFASTTAKLARLLQLPHDSKPTDAHSPHAQISYKLLWAIFPMNSLVVGLHENSGEKCAFKVKNACYAYDSSLGSIFDVSGHALAWNGTKYARATVRQQIVKFKGLRRVSTLQITPLKPGTKTYEDLQTRGKLYCDLSGVKFLKYEGVLTQMIGHGSMKTVIKLRADGRVVVDAKSFQKMNPGRATGAIWNDDEEDDDDCYFDMPPLPGMPALADGHYGAVIPASRRSYEKESFSSASNGTDVAPRDLVLLPPTVYAFSLALREWGEMSVVGFDKITFRTDAWDRLVVDKDYKELIRSLVEQSTSRKGQRMEKAGEEKKDVDGREDEGKILGDIVEGKGGGLVIALHGLPGVGKTLTAEAVAESLRVPLYTVGAGSLGVAADVLEKRLRDILDIASAWGATLLIDEADVFLEARAQHDISRNALVSVFLRLIEYNSGVLFLTTNRIRNIDEAFLSRFSLAVTYPNLDAAKRRVIWCDFLEHAHIGIQGSSKLVNGNGPGKELGKDKYEGWLSGEYVDKLAKKKDFNGRIIKNIVRTAQSLSRSQGVALSERHLDVVIKANEAFVRDYKEADEAGVYEVKGEGWKDHTNVYG